MHTNRTTRVLQGPLASRMQRLAAADQGALGLQFTTMPLLAARLAGGFFRPAHSDDLESALQTALKAGGFAEIEPLCALPGMARAAARTLRRVWDADVGLETLRSPRLSDLALLERRVRECLPPAVKLPRDLRQLALSRLQHAESVIGKLVLDRFLSMPLIWQPLIRSLSEVISVEWIEPGTPDTQWFTGQIIAAPPRALAPSRLVSCANPRSEVIESLRWARQLLASGNVRPQDIALCAATTDEWDEHVLALAKGAGLPIHLSSGLPALSTREGQACASLADVLLNGLSQDRVRRLFGHAIGQSRLLKELPRDWVVGISPDAGLFHVDHWRRALASAAPRGTPGANVSKIVQGALELLSRGISVAHEAGEEFLSPSARLLWQRALKCAPAEALGLSLQALRLTDESEAASSIVWCPAAHLVGAPRPYVWLLGLTSGMWPVRPREDPLLPDHLLSKHVLDPDPIGNQQRRAFELIREQASGACLISRSRRSAQGGLLPISPLLASLGPAKALKRGRIPQHAFSETDRLLARPQDAAASPRIRSAMSCWSDWSAAKVTEHDGRVRAHHPVIDSALRRPQSATSLGRLLRNPLAFVWRYTLGWHAPALVEEPLSIDARAWGELVHELLRRTVNQLEPDPGYTRADATTLRNALHIAASQVRDQWPLERPVPPLLLWQHTLAHAEELAFRALRVDATFSPGTRCWTEVPFGSREATPGNWLWDTTALVIIPGTSVSLRGSIDRLDLNAPGTSVRVTDYKTGPEPPRAEQIIVSGGASLQRVIYAIAANQLLPDVRRVIARLFYLGEEAPRSRELPNVDQAVQEVSGYVQQAWALLNEGTTLPGLVHKQYDDYRIALPADAEEYLRIKHAAFRRAFGAYARIWNAP